MPSERIFRRNSEDTLAACFALDIEVCKGLFLLQFSSVGLVITGLGFPVLERSQSAALPALVPSHRAKSYLVTYYILALCVYCECARLAEAGKERGQRAPLPSSATEPSADGEPRPSPRPVHPVQEASTRQEGAGSGGGDGASSQTAPS